VSRPENAADVSVILVGSSPWRPLLTPDDLNLRPALALARRLGGRYDVVVPQGGAPVGDVDLGAVRLHRVPDRDRLTFLLAARRAVDRAAAAGPGAAASDGSNGRRILISSDPLAALAIETSRARSTMPHLVQIQGEVLKPGPEYGGRLKRISLGAVARFAVRRANGVRVVSDVLRAAVAGMCDTPVAMIGSRVDTALFAPTPGALQDRSVAGGGDRPYAIMVGALAARKNHTTVVHAWRAVLDAVPGARLVILGEGDRRPVLEVLIDRLGLGDDIELAGAVDHPDVVRRLAGARCLLHPSWSEGQPRAVLEAMASGVPVICSDIPEHRELVTADVGRLVPTDDPAAWAAAVIRLLGDPSAGAMGDRARRLVVDRHDYDASIDRFADFIRQVAAAPARAPTR